MFIFFFENLFFLSCKATTVNITYRINHLQIITFELNITLLQATDTLTFSDGNTTEMLFNAASLTPKVFQNVGGYYVFNSTG